MKASHISIILFLLYRTVSVSGRTAEDVMNEWSSYKNECLHRVETEPSPKDLMCNRMFDGFACWPDGRPNSTVKVPCPWYLPWYNQVHGGFVLRECGPDGKWATRNSSHTWRNHSQCDAADSQEVDKMEQMKILACFRVMYTVCYCLSLVSLSVALIILLFFSKLHCTRNSIHSNLFASFILRALSILTRDAVLSKTHPEFRHNMDVSQVLSDQGLSSCRVAQVLMQYCVGANYYWLLVEGLYLHNLLALVAFSENRFFCGYLLIGWGTPVLFVIPWIVVRCLYENTRCWEINENMAYWCIIRTPILLAIIVNFFIFIRIILILMSKLKAHQMRSTDYKFRLAKSTLTLIPLLGIHELLFAVSTNVQTEEVFRNASLFFQLFFNSSQGFLVAVLYCFVNKEVQAEIKKTWQRWKLGMTDLDELRNTGSNTVQAPLSMPPSSQCHHLSPYQPPTRCPEVSHLSSIPHTSPPLPPQVPIPHSCTHHQDKMANKQLKSSCCISAHTQDRRGEDEEKSCEMYC